MSYCQRDLSFAKQSDFHKLKIFVNLQTYGTNPGY